MLTHTSALRALPKHVALALLVISLVALAPARAFAQAAPQDDPDRQKAFELFDNQQFADAMPLLEKLAAKYPSDGQVMARLGIAVFGSAVTIGDPQKRQKERARGRAFLARAKELGVTNDLIEGVLNGVAPDGSILGGGDNARESFSSNREADEAMRAGEAAFNRNDYDAALKAYERALSLDPQLYEAPLFEGDVYMQRQEWEKAAAAYARAAQINPDKETAYRYWGDTLMRQARLDDARDKYVEAVIAEPYNAYVWRNGIARWAAARGLHLGQPKIEPMSSVSPTKDNQTTITIDPKAGTDDGTAAWMMYGIARAAWTVDNNERFRKQYPSETKYRHSLAEEADALRMVVASVRQQQKDGKARQLDPALAELAKLEGDGLLEAYVLFARADDGIAQDYAAYRKANRDKLRRYLIEYVASGRY
jgi:tetratricopeptide (TPR) repeat protein